MVNRNYTCDYCQNTFKDTPQLRAKHLQGLQHRVKYANHYEKFKGQIFYFTHYFSNTKILFKKKSDPAVVLQEESRKLHCIKAANENCPFGFSCRYTHYKPKKILKVIAQAKIIEEQNREKNLVRPATEEKLDDFFRKRNGRIIVDSMENPIFWDYPHELLSYHNLPPSLQPIDPLKINPADFQEWG